MHANVLQLEYVLDNRVLEPSVSVCEVCGGKEAKEHNVLCAGGCRPPLHKHVNKHTAALFVYQSSAVCALWSLIMFSLHVRFLSFIMLCLKGACLCYCGGHACSLLVIHSGVFTFFFF